MLEFLCASLAVIVAGLIVKVWQYRAAIIQLQADMTLVLNELTRPVRDRQTMITCNQCVTVLTPEEFLSHRCRRVMDRAEAMTEAQVNHVYDAR